MPKLDIRHRLTPGSLRALELSGQQYATFKAGTLSALEAMRAGYRHERRFWNSAVVELASVQNHVIDTPAGTVPVRLYRPGMGSPIPVLVYAHGGGYIVGDLDTHDRICRLLARRSGWAVLAIDYTLAPEKQFPVQPDQVLGVLHHVAAHGAQWGLDTKRIAIGGDSAGAHLSLGAALDVRAAGGPQLLGQLLYYGAYGLKDSASRRMYGWADLDGMGDEDTAMYRDAYIPNPADRDHPRNNLLKADMAGLPPAFIVGVEFDPLRDDSLALAAFMRERGVRHELKIYEGVLHAFLHYSMVEPLAMDAIEAGADFLAGL